MVGEDGENLGTSAALTVGIVGDIAVSRVVENVVVGVFGDGAEPELAG